MYDSWVIDEATVGPVLSDSSAEPTITPRARNQNACDELTSVIRESQPASNQ
jgi:hypothetical protein